MEQVVAYVISAVLGITAVGAWVAKTKNWFKYLKLASACINLVDNLLKTIEDGKVTEDEVKKLASESVEIKEAYILIKKR